MGDQGINGRLGVKWLTLLPFGVVIIGGGIVWGETRYKVTDNLVKLAQVEKAHDEDIKVLKTEQDELDDNLDKVIRQQGVMDERLKNIQEIQTDQKDTMKAILYELRRTKPDPGSGR